jgi:uncharacterized protein (TIGR03066 family)
VVASGETMEGGSFKAELPSQGTYTVNLSRAGYDPSQTSIDVNLTEVSKKLFLKPIAVVRKPVELWTLNVLVREGGVTATRPIEGADVKVSNAKMAVVKTGRTDSLGRFPADGLEAGLYTAEASKAGYSLREKPRANISRGDAQVEVSLYRVVVPTPLVTVPDVTGRQSLQARQAIEAARLTFSPANDAIQGGTVTSQTPAAGARVSPGTMVVVTFTVPVPDVRGMMYSEAQQRLQDRGLVPQFNPEGVENRSVVNQQVPPAGTQVAHGTGVTLAFARRPTAPVEIPNAPMPPPANPNVLVGVWAAREGSETVPPGTTLEFTEDGRVTVVAYNDTNRNDTLSFSGTYELYGKKLKMDLTVGNERKSGGYTIYMPTPRELVTVDETTQKKDVYIKK